MSFRIIETKKAAAAVSTPSSFVDGTGIWEDVWDWDFPDADQDYPDDDETPED